MTTAVMTAMIAPAVDARRSPVADALTWRPSHDCRLTETIVAVWRSRTRHPTVRAVTRRLRQELGDGPWRPQEPRAQLDV